MAIFKTSFIFFIIAFIVSMSMITSSSTVRKLTDHDIRHLCSKTRNSEACYKLVKSDNRTANADSKGLVDVLVDKASRQAKKIQLELNAVAKATHDPLSRNRYSLISKKYNNAIRNLETARNKLRSGAYRSVHVHVNNAHEEIRSCANLLVGAHYHAHVQTKNNDLEFLLSVAKAAADVLNKK